MLRISLLLIFLISPAFMACGGKKADTYLKLRGFELREYPKQTPRQLPQLFMYTGATIQSFGHYKPERFLPSPEGVAVMYTIDKPSIVEAFYLKQINDKGWNIIQSKRKSSEILLMTESPGAHYKKLVTIIIRGKGPSTIKVYFKSSEDG